MLEDFNITNLHFGQTKACNEDLIICILITYPEDHCQVKQNNK